MKQKRIYHLGRKKVEKAMLRLWELRASAIVQKKMRILKSKEASKWGEVSLVMMILERKE